MGQNYVLGVWSKKIGDLGGELLLGVEGWEGVGVIGKPIYLRMHKEIIAVKSGSLEEKISVKISRLAILLAHWWQQ